MKTPGSSLVIRAFSEMGSGSVPLGPALMGRADESGLYPECCCHVL